MVGYVLARQFIEGKRMLDEAFSPPAKRLRLTGGSGDTPATEQRPSPTPKRPRRALPDPRVVKRLAFTPETMPKRRNFGYAPAYVDTAIGLATKKAKKTPISTVRMTADVVAEHDKDKGVAWFGWSTVVHDDTMLLIARHIVQRILIRCGSTVTRGTTVPDVLKTSVQPKYPCIDHIVFHFRTDTYRTTPPTEDNAWNAIMHRNALENKTFDEVSESMKTVLITAQQENRVLTSYEVYKIQEYHNDPQSNEVCFWFKQEGIDRATVSFRTNMHIRMQNQTTAAADAYDKHDIRANPLVGRVYDFESATPRFRRAYIDDCNENNVDPATMTKSDLNNGNIDTTGTRDSTGLPYGVWKEPFTRTRPVFERLTGTAYVSIAPGGFANASRTYTNNGNFGKFFIGVRGDHAHYLPAPHQPLPSCGTSVLFCFAHKMREAGTLAEAANIKIVANIRRTMEIDVKYPKAPSLVTYNKTA